MRIEVTEPGGFQDDGTSFHFGDVVTVQPEKGGYYCSMGWAKDVDGQVATGARNTGPAMLQTFGQPAKPTRPGPIRG